MLEENPAPVVTSVHDEMDVPDENDVPDMVSAVDRVPATALPIYVRFGYESAMIKLYLFYLLGNVTLVTQVTRLEIECIHTGQ